MNSKTTENGNQFFWAAAKNISNGCFLFSSLMEKTKTAVLLKSISIARYSIRKLGNVSIIQDLSVFLSLSVMSIHRNMTVSARLIWVW